VRKLIIVIREQFPFTLSLSKGSSEEHGVVRRAHHERMSDRRLVRLVPVLFMASLLGACGTSEILQSKAPEPQVYVINPLDTGTAQIAFNHQLAIALPTATPGLDTNRIAVLRDGNHLDYYFGARWGGTAPQVVQAFIVSLLQSQQGFRNVVAEDARVDADYLLEISITNFQADNGNGGAPSVRVALVGNLIDVKRRTSSPLMRATATVISKDNRLGAVVSAFQAALQQSTLSLSEQVTALVGK